MSWLTLAQAVVQLILLIVSKWFENNAEKKKKQAEIIKDLSGALQAGDASAALSAMQQLR